MSLVPICQFPEAYADNAERESKSIITQPNHAKTYFTTPDKVFIPGDGDCRKSPETENLHLYSHVTPS